MNTDNIKTGTVIYRKHTNNSGGYWRCFKTLNGARAWNLGGIEDYGTVKQGRFSIVIEENNCGPLGGTEGAWIVFVPEYGEFAVLSKSVVKEMLKVIPSWSEPSFALIALDKS